MILELWLDELAKDKEEEEEEEEEELADLRVKSLINSLNKLLRLSLIYSIKE